jgi:small subunit ribosomal protein S17
VKVERLDCFSTRFDTQAVTYQMPHGIRINNEQDEMMKRENIGIPVKPPEAKCQDMRCPWHGSLPVRGGTFHGRVTSSKARDTVVVEWGYTHILPKYERYERRRSRVVAHNPDCMKARDGDEVIIAECRPLSKTKHFVIVAVTRRKSERPEFKVAEIEADAESSVKKEKKEEHKEETKERKPGKKPPKKK